MTTATLPGWVEMVRTSLAPETREQVYETPGDMAEHLDRNTVQTPALQLIDEHLVRVAKGALQRLAIAMPPQEGKSSRTSVWFVLWMLVLNPNLRIVIVSATASLAQGFGGQIRNLLDRHPELGLRLSQDTRAKKEFKLLGYRGGVYCVGIDGNLIGRPADLMIIDDPYSNSAQADSEAWRRTVRSFWTDVAVQRLAPGAPVVVIQTRWREDDLTGWLLEDGEEWEELRIPAQADHNSDEGERDPLGREPGEFMVSARGRTAEEFERKRREVGSRTWEAMYQGRPSPTEGTIFKREWWQQYEQPLWLERADGSRVLTNFDDTIASWDMTFKDTDGTDFVVGQVWGRRGADVFLLDQVRARMDFPATCNAVRQLEAKWPQVLRKLVEDKANGTAVVASLKHTVRGIIAEEPQGSKVARASAVSPLVEAEQVWLPSPALAPWVGDFIEECAGFPTAKHDDQVDAMSQALNRLVLQPLLDGRIVRAEDLDEELAQFGAYVP